MNDLKRLALTAALSLGAWLAANPGAWAHPHIFAEARLEVETTAEGGIAELRSVWRFDEVFSSSVIIDFDANKNLEMDPDELQKVASVVMESLAEFNYFVTLSQDGKEIAVKPPKHMVADYKDGLLLLIFAVEPERTMSLSGDISVGIYDPTMYTAIDFPQDSDLIVTGAATEKCISKVVRPDPDEVIAQNQASLTEAFFSDPGGNDLSKLFATRLDLDCK